MVVVAVLVVSVAELVMVVLADIVEVDVLMLVGETGAVGQPGGKVPVTVEVM